MCDCSANETFPKKRLRDFVDSKSSAQIKTIVSERQKSIQENNNLGRYGGC
jgi:hypothetical protein